MFQLLPKFRDNTITLSKALRELRGKNKKKHVTKVYLGVGADNEETKPTINRKMYKISNVSVVNRMPTDTEVTTDFRAYLGKEGKLFSVAVEV